VFEHGDGAIPYFEAKRAVVAWSDPLCPEEALPEILGRFIREVGRRVCLVAVNEATTRAALAAGFSALKITSYEPSGANVNWLSLMSARTRPLKPPSAASECTVKEM